MQVDQFVDAFFGETARGVDGRSPDWNMGKVENYQRIDAWLFSVDGPDGKEHIQECLSTPCFVSVFPCKSESES